MHWAFPHGVAEAIVQVGSLGDGGGPAQALAQGDCLARLRQLIDTVMLFEDDPAVAQGLNGYQRRCLGKLRKLEDQEG